MSSGINTINLSDDVTLGGAYRNDGGYGFPVGL